MASKPVLIESYQQFKDIYGPPSISGTPLQLNLAPLTGRARWRSRWTALGEWAAWHVLKLAPRFRDCVRRECIDAYEDERVPTLRRLWRPWVRG